MSLPKKKYGGWWKIVLVKRRDFELTIKYAVITIDNDEFTIANKDSDVVLNAKRNIVRKVQKIPYGIVITVK